MSTPIFALALVVMCALFSAAASDSAQAIGLRNQAADEARRVATEAVNRCAVGSTCGTPPGCAAPRCKVCHRGNVLRADIELDWSPALLKGLAPADGLHVLSVEHIDLTALVGSSLSPCA